MCIRDRFRRIRRRRAASRWVGASAWEASQSTTALAHATRSHTRGAILAVVMPPGSGNMAP
eukprot:12472349-Alexandrium_andersonii.AAC.1